MATFSGKMMGKWPKCRKMMEICSKPIKVSEWSTVVYLKPS
jgi:hypothetical protein